MKTKGNFCFLLLIILFYNFYRNWVSEWTLVDIFGLKRVRTPPSTDLQLAICSKQTNLPKNFVPGMKNRHLFFNLLEVF